MVWNAMDWSDLNAEAKIAKLAKQMNGFASDPPRSVSRSDFHRREDAVAG
jgi:hypothetical protein